MNPIRIAHGALLILAVPGLSAQELSELCPESEPGTAAVFGVVADVESRMALPGAKVLATWERDGARARAETDTGLDGSFTICHLPLETDLSVQAMFATLTGEAISLNLSERVTRQDLDFSLSGGRQGSGDNRMWACIDRPDSQIRQELGNLVRCDALWRPLEQCPREELGRVTASAATARRSERKEMVDRLIDEARRLNANALINVNISDDAMEARAVRIDVDPATCS